MTWKRNFDVCLYTPIGKRFGCMSVCRQGCNLNGNLDILSHVTPFTGEMDHAGNCRIIGHMVTLTRTICYEAYGEITPEDVRLTLLSDKYKYELTGKVRETEQCI